MYGEFFGRSGASFAILGNGEKSVILRPFSPRSWGWRGEYLIPFRDQLNLSSSSEQLQDRCKAAHAKVGWSGACCPSLQLFGAAREAAMLRQDAAVDCALGERWLKKSMIRNLG